MKLYKTQAGILLENNEQYYLVENEDWDTFVNDDDLFQKLEKISTSTSPFENSAELIENSLQAPIQSQEVWASGVTYFRSKEGRQEESQNSGGADFYQHVYEAERPELFFKATPNRVVGTGQQVRIRKDSSWDVPEPELTLMLSSSGKIIAYTIGNDMSSRSIEGENPLYLPQAKTYDGCAALGPCLYITKEPLPSDTTIGIQIERKGEIIFSDTVEINQIKRSFTELAGFLYRECSFAHGSFLMTGTGIVPASDFTLQSKDKITITIDHIGILINTVE